MAPFVSRRWCRALLPVALLCTCGSLYGDLLASASGSAPAAQSSPLDALDGAQGAAAVLSFGAPAPPATSLPMPTQHRGHWCGGRWCAELRPEHFASAEGQQSRGGAYKNIAAPVDAKANRSPRSRALPEFAVLRTLKYGEGYVFGCRKGDELRLSALSGGALLRKWHTSAAEALSAVDYPGTGVTGCNKKFKTAEDDHLVVILTDEGWAALLTKSFGGHDLGSPRPQRRVRAVVFERSHLSDLQSISGLGDVGKAARQNFFPDRAEPAPDLYAEAGADCRERLAVVRAQTPGPRAEHYRVHDRRAGSPMSSPAGTL